VMDFGLVKLKGLVAPAAGRDARGVRDRRGDGAPHGRGPHRGDAALHVPEQAQGRDIDQRSDIFSFGSMLYEMVSGRRPFQGGSAITTLAAVIEKEPAP